MKTLEELYSEVMSSDELKKEFISLKPGQVEEFTAKHGCRATLDEIKAFLTEKTKTAGSQGEPGELSDSEIEQAAGGKGDDVTESWVSMITVGVGCSIMAIISVSGGRCGTAIAGERMLCEMD